jgi:hypothetical protein
MNYFFTPLSEEGLREILDDAGVSDDDIGAEEFTGC